MPFVSDDDAPTHPCANAPTLNKALARDREGAGATSAPPTLLIVGATGGLRSAIDEGKLGQRQVKIIRAAFVAAFQNVHSLKLVKFEVVTGQQEAAWEHKAAQSIWGRERSSIFPSAATAAASAAIDINLFSGGGKSMQVGRRGSALSFPFSTFPKELEERQGAHPDAWQDPVKWGRFTRELTAKIKLEAKLHSKFTVRRCVLHGRRFCLVLPCLVPCLVYIF